MPVIEAVSLTNNVNDWLVDTHHPRILHVFDSVCNLINEHGNVLSIVTEQIGNGPFNLVVKDEILFSRQLNLESNVLLSATEITLGDLTVSTAYGKLWNPRPDWLWIREKRSDIIYHLSKASIPAHKLSISDSMLTAFITSVDSADISASITASTNLAGFGVGLTPEGDDFILGALYAAWIIHPIEVASLLAKEITDAAAPLTTSLSAAWLKAAGKGEAGQVWHDLFDAFLSTDKMAVQESVKKILAVGHTSGADALAGFLGIFNSYVEQK